MKILFLTKKFPYPLKDGESIAVTNLSRSLHLHGCKLHLLSMNTTKHWVDVPQIEGVYNHFELIETVPLDNRVTVGGALKNIVTSESYHVSRFSYTAYAKKLQEMLTENNYDVVQLETLYLASYLDLIRETAPHTKVIMRSHNIEYEIWERITAHTMNPFKKIYLSIQTNRLKQFDQDHASRYDGLVTVTERDRLQYLKMGCNSPSMTMPIGLDVSKYEYEDIVPSDAISFIGSLDWPPNLEGLNWFLKNVWEKLLSQKPSVKLHIAGRNTPETIFKLQSENIIVHGEVDDAHLFLKEYPVTIVPLLSGSGMRVKIIEGMALGRAVVSTRIGAEGINATDEKELMLADDADHFAHKILHLLDHPHIMLGMGMAARSFIDNHFDQAKNTARLIDFYKNLCALDS